MTSSPSSPSRTRIVGMRTAAIVGVVAGVVVAVLIAALVGVLRASASDAADERARTELRREAGRIVAQIFSVDAATWRADRARARGLMAGEFAARYAAELGRPPADGARRITWTSDAVAVADATAESGDVVIAGTVVTTPADAATPVTEKLSVTVRFDRDGDRWVVTGVDVVS
ncbi:hypothetical protein [Gordonia rhizosphera]|nr:hypothetical protein [Gordonia rhizosphera]